MRTFIILLLLSLNVVAEEIAPFTSDGCSSFPDGTFVEQTLWQRCCTLHDYAYWKGGSYQQRLDADIALEHCVADVGEPEIGMIMLVGVRVGGSPFFPTSYRWGYGWPYPRSYGELSKEELKQVEEKSKKIKF